MKYLLAITGMLALSVYGLYQGLQPRPVSVEIEIISTPTFAPPPKTAYIIGVNEDGTVITATKEEYDRYWAELED